MARGYDEIDVGEVVTAVHMNDKWLKQSILYFADATARDAAVTAPEEGMVAYLADVNGISVYNGSAWRVWLPELTTKGDLYVRDTTHVVRKAVGSDGTFLQADSSQTGGIKWSAAASSFAILSTWDIPDAEAVGTSPVEMNRAGTGNVKRMTMSRAGSITGIMIALESARATNSFTAEAYINGAATGLTVEINGTNTQYHYAVQATGLDTFVAGDEVSIYCYETSTFTTSAANGGRADLEVAFD